MLDAYAASTDAETAARLYAALGLQYEQIFRRLGLGVRKGE
jgi:prolyl-tRNA synthetase